MTLREGFYPECWNRRCEHHAEAHVLARKDDLPDVLCDAPCTVEGCLCDDYDGMEHPERPSLADAVISRDEDGRVQVTTTEADA